MKKLIFFAVLSCIIVGSAFAREEGAVGKSAGKAVSGNTIKTERLVVTAGQTFSVTVESNPTTGYRWELAKPLDEAILKLVGSEYKKPATNLVGAGGKEVWVFKAMTKGQTSIQMKYVRPWEKGVGPAREATFTVIVQ